MVGFFYSLWFLLSRGSNPQGGLTVVCRSSGKAAHHYLQALPQPRSFCKCKSNKWHWCLSDTHSAPVCSTKLCSPELRIWVQAAVPFVWKLFEVKAIREFAPFLTAVTLHPVLVWSFSEDNQRQVFYSSYTTKTVIVVQ